MPNLRLNTQEILESIASVVGYNRDPSEWDEQTKTDARRIIRSGLRRFFTPMAENGVVYQWSFLERPFLRQGEGAYSTGTISLAAGVAVLSDGFWPPWAKDGILRVDGRTLYVSEVLSSTSLRVNNLGVEFPAETAYALYRWRYPMPDDFGEFFGGVVYSVDTKNTFLRNVTESEIRLRHAANFREECPSMYATVANQHNLLESTVRDSITLPYFFSTDTAATDPTSGYLKLSASNQSTSNALRVDSLDATGTDWDAVIATFDDSTDAVKGYLKIVGVDDPDAYIVFRVDTVQSQSGWRNILVTKIESSEASPFANNDAVLLQFTRTEEPARWYFTFWGTAAAGTTFMGTYLAMPLDNLDDEDLLDGLTTVQIDAVHAETVLTAILSAAEEFYGAGQGVHSQRFGERLAASIAHDRHAQGPVSHSAPKAPGSWEYYMLNHVPDYEDLIE